MAAASGNATWAAAAAATAGLRGGSFVWSWRVSIFLLLCQGSAQGNVREGGLFGEVVVLLVEHVWGAVGVSGWSQRPRWNGSECLRWNEWLVW